MKYLLIILLGSCLLCSCAYDAETDNTTIKLPPQDTGINLNHTQKKNTPATAKDSVVRDTTF